MRRVGRTWPALLLIAATATSLAHANEPKPAPLARYFPAKDLVAYVEFDGIDAHADAWKKTAAYKILNETPAGAMLESVVRQLPFAKVKVGEFETPSFDDLSGVVRQMVRSGFALGINRKAGDPSAKPSCIGLVVRNGARGPIGPAITKILQSIDLDQKAVAEREAKGGRKLSLFGSAIGPGVAWWAEGDDLAFCFMDVNYSETMIAALEGKEPNAVEHSLRKELAARVDGFEPVGLAFLDAKAFPDLPPEAALFGLDAIRRVDVRWGYRGEALESVSRVVAPAPRKGVLALFDQPTFDAKSMPPLPDGVGSYSVTSIDLVKVFDRLQGLATESGNPVLGPAFGGFVEMFHQGTGRRLRDDILTKIGPRFLLADVPTSVLVSTSPFDAMAREMARVPRLSLLVEIKNRARLLEDLEALAGWANEQFPLPKRPGDKAGKPAPLLVRKLKNVEAGYEVALSPTYWPLPAGYRPSMVVGEKFLSLGTTPDVARLALRTGGETPAPMARALASVPGDLTLLSVSDTKNTALAELLANVPSLIQWWAFAIQGVDLANPVTVTTPDTPAGKPDEPGDDELEAKPSLLAFRLRLDPDEIPTPEEIRSFLFPATYSLSSDAQGFRFASSEAFPSWNPTGLIPLAVSAALPMVQSWRDSSEKEQLSVNLRQVGKALDEYQKAKQAYPAPAIADQQGKPLLSWRVAILPFLGQKSLYEEFHRDEPWDSPHNKPLIERMPAAFAHPTAKAEPGLTFYRGIIGKRAFFDLEGGVTVASITDGTVNTLAIVEAREAVPWTKPGTEIDFDGPALLPLLGGHKSGQFAALFVDGSVKFLSESINPLTLRSLSTRNGGEVISNGSF